MMITEDHSYIPTTAEEWLELASDIAIDYDGCETVEGLKDLIDEMRSIISSAKGMESIMRIMDVVGVEALEDMKGKYVRIASKGLGSSVKIIGNIISDKWFDYESFFEG